MPNGSYTEAFLRHYHLSLSMVRYILKTADSDLKLSAKPRPLIKQFVKAEKKNPNVQTVIESRHVKDISEWFGISEGIFKKLRHQLPANPRRLLNDATRISSVLVEAANKIKPKKTAGRPAAPSPVKT